MLRFRRDENSLVASWIRAPTGDVGIEVHALEEISPTTLTFYLNGSFLTPYTSEEKQTTISIASCQGRWSTYTVGPAEKEASMNNWEDGDLEVWVGRDSCWRWLHETGDAIADF